MAKNTDLHTHSHYSDGQNSPKELVRLAKKKGIKNLALTDHDSVKGVREAIAEGNKIGVNVIPAVEIRVKSGEVLGYFIDIKNKELIKKLEQRCQIVEGDIKEWCKKLSKNSYNISFKELQKKFPKAKGNLKRFHVLQVLYQKGYGKPMKLAKKLHENKKLKTKEIKKMPIIQAIRLIKKSGGVPVLAHPWVDDMRGNFKIMKLLAKAGLKGIEINNGDRAPFKPRVIDKKIRRIAKKYNLILTSGSDFHGKELIKLMPGDHDIGKNNCDGKVVEELRKLARK